MSKKKQKKNKELSVYAGIIHFCTMILCVMFPLLLFRSEIQELSFWLQPIVILIFGVGGVGLYIALGSAILREMETWD